MNKETIDYYLKPMRFKGFTKLCKESEKDFYDWLEI